MTDRRRRELCDHSKAAGKLVALNATPGHPAAPLPHANNNSNSNYSSRVLPPRKQLDNRAAACSAIHPAARLRSNDNDHNNNNKHKAGDNSGVDPPLPLQQAHQIPSQRQRQLRPWSCPELRRPLLPMLGQRQHQATAADHTWCAKGGSMAMCPPPPPGLAAACCWIPQRTGNEEHKKWHAEVQQRTT